MSNIFDEITSKALAASSQVGDGTDNNGNRIAFIPTAKFQGYKPGYYFGTSDEGTGYYIDLKAQSLPSSSLKRKRDVTESKTSSNKRTVRFGNNEVKTIPSLKKSDIMLSDAQDLLKAAEERQRSLKTKTLDLSRGQSSVKSMISTLEQSIAKNELLRIEYSDEPEKFMESEVALYEDIKVLNDLAANVEYYQTFASYGVVDQLLALLAHSNTDIALVVIRVFVELLDQNLFLEDESKSVSFASLLLAFLGSGKNGGISLTIDNLTRLNCKEEEEMKGIDDILSLIENLLDLDQMGAVKYALKTSSEENSKREYISVVKSIIESTTFLGYLFEKLNDDSGFSLSAKLHCAEILASILQHEDSKEGTRDLCDISSYKSQLDTGNKKDEKIDGLEQLLQCVAQYRKRDPSSEEECEYIENIFDSLASSMQSEENVNSFVEKEGVELMQRCIQQGVHSGSASLKVLFFAVSGPFSTKSKSYQRATEAFVNAGGLKSLFPIIMGKKSILPKPSPNCDAGNIKLLKKYSEYAKSGKKKSKKMKQVVALNREWYREIESYAIQILFHLTRYLDDDTPFDAKDRLVAKFIENDCEKCDRLIELCLKYDTKMRQAEYNYFKSEEAELVETGVEEFAAMNAKLASGGDLFHRLSAILSFVITSSKRCHSHVLQQLLMQNSGISLIKTGCEEFLTIIEEGPYSEKLALQLTKL